MKLLLIGMLMLAGCAHNIEAQFQAVDSRDPSSEIVKANDIVCAYGFYRSEYDDCRPIAILQVPVIAGKLAQCPEKYSALGSTFGADKKAYWVCNLER